MSTRKRRDRFVSKTEVPDGCPLSNSEFACVEMLSKSLTYKQIAAQLFVSVSTIRTHLHSVYMKLDVKDRAQAVILCTREGWLGEEVDTSWEDERCSPAQRLYLDAFDEFLLGKEGARRLRETGVYKCDPPHSQREPKDEIIQMGKRSHHLVSMCIEQDIPMPEGQGVQGKRAQTERRRRERG